MKRASVLIIGGGASGLMTAVTLHQLGIENVIILERLSRTGKKILATGNGRCNLSHTHITASDYQGSYDVDAILKQFGKAESFFENLGLFCRTDEQGRIYPYSLSASSVLDTLRLCCQETELCEERAVKLDFQSGLWHVTTEKEHTFSADYVVFSAGGNAGDKFGTDGTAWKLLKSLQIPVIAGRPILCPLLSDKSVLKILKGLRVKGSVSLYHKNNLLRTETGEIQFTEQAVSGICVFNLVSLIDRRHFSDYQLSVNLFPELSQEELLSRFYTCQSVRNTQDCQTMLSGLMRKTMAVALLKKLNLPETMPCHLLTDFQMQQLAGLCQDFRFPVQGTVNAQAQACAGGVAGSALDNHLQVKTHPGLFVTGEAIDVHAPCGGYQLHWAWASGYTVGTYLAETLLS